MPLLHRPFARVGIINRGEAALRFVRAARHWSKRRNLPLEVVAFYTDPDRNALFVREADEAIALGPALVPGAQGSAQSAYLDIARIVDALRAAHCDAAWPGWGFLAERPDFADACTDAGVVFIGPSAETMRRLGDKIAARRIAEAQGVSVTDWSGGAVATADEALVHAERIGFPVVIKASAGGGGRGIRLVHEAQSLHAAFASAALEARNAFGDDTLFVESLMPEARHVEVQIVADRHGHTLSLGTRDCSLQRRHQKVLEEAPAPGLGALEDALQSAAIAVAKACGYTNAGTVEFLVRPDGSGFAFLEINTRLQVEHPVTECVTGLDLVGLQIDIARGDALPATAPRPRGHAIEARLNAEDPTAGFRPSVGRLLRLDLPAGPGIRVDAGFAAGDTVPSEFDSMLAKIVAYGDTRDEALSRLEDALAHTVVALEGGPSNRCLLRALCAHPAFRAGPVTTRWLDRALEPASPDAPPRPHEDIALAVGAIGELRRARAEEVASLLSLAQRGLPPAVPPAEPRTVRFVTATGPESLEVLATGPRLYRVTRNGHRMRLRFRATGANTATLTRGDTRWRVVEIATPTAVSVEVEGVAHRLERASEGRIVAPVPAAVTAVCVQEGATVRAGDRLVLLEVMKMELAVTAPTEGRVSRVLVAPASRVVAGQLLVLLDAVDSEAAAPRGPESADVVSGDIPPVEDLLRGAMLGYDLSPSEIDLALDAVRTGESPITCESLHTLLAAFVDGERLFDVRPGVDGVAPADHLARYLRWRTAEGLPASFLQSLRAALGWHRLDDLRPSLAHDDALARILQAHGARTLRERIVRQCLAAALRQEPQPVSATAREALRTDLERFAGVVVSRDRSLAESAYTALYLLCDRPRQREEIDALGLATARAFVALVDPTLDPHKLARLHKELDDFSHGALLALLGRVLGPVEESTLLDLLVRRLYPTAAQVSAVSLGPTRLRCVAEGGPVLALLAPSATRITATVQDCAAELDGVRAVEVFVPEPEAAVLGAMEQELAAALGALPPWIARVSVNWGSVAEGRLSRTYRRAGEAFREESFLRDLHPARVEVAELDRFAAFDLERLDAPGEILVVGAQARSDPSDRRLVCVVEVERVDPVRDPETGVLLSVPSFERAFLMAIYALRAALERAQPNQRPYWNQIVAYVRPLLTIRADEMDVITRRLGPATAGIGLEKMVMRCRLPSRTLPDGRPMQLVWTNPTGHGATLTLGHPDMSPVEVLTAAERRMMEARRRGMLDPYELVRSLSRDDDTGPLPRGRFEELDLDEDGTTLVPVRRPEGQHRANLVVGLLTNTFGPFADGLTRVLLVGDPTRAMGSLAEAECRRVIAALDLAERNTMIVEWVAVSSGARIAMDSGTENLDWTARALARLVAFTQAGGTVNILVDNINVGAQSYWNAEATMLQHCRGALVMTPAGSMLLTGKRALEYAGSVAAEDNAGIGGQARVMGPNGQAQYFAPDLVRAYALLFRHMTFTAVPPGETRPRRLVSRDPIDRDITRTLYDAEDGAEGFRTVGEIFDEAINPGRKRPFAIRSVMRAVLDADIEPMERWDAWQGAEGAVVWEASLGGDPVCCIGIESRPLPRRGEAPADGPAQWTSGTLFPQSSKKVARALNAASGVRPVVLLANLSGFDGSPDSLRHLQLEYGAEIGRAVVNFRGPLVFCVVGRYHGGAYVVFSRALNPGIRAVALEGAFASVIGGGPAAAVVFPGMVRKRAEADPAVIAARATLDATPRARRAAVATEYARVLREAEARAQAAVAREFDAVHSVERALAVGSLEAILAPAALRPALIERIRTPAP